MALLHDSTAARVGALFQLLVQDTTALPNSLTILLPRVCRDWRVEPAGIAIFCKMMAAPEADTGLAPFFSGSRKVHPVTVRRRQSGSSC